MYGSFFFIERTVSGTVYLDTMSEWLILQLTEDIPNIVFQLNTFSIVVRQLDWSVWNKRKISAALPAIFLWGPSKTNCTHLCLKNLDELRQLIQKAVQSIVQEILQNIWS